MTRALYRSLFIAAALRARTGFVLLAGMPARKHPAGIAEAHRVLHLYLKNKR